MYLDFFRLYRPVETKLNQIKMTKRNKKNRNPNNTQQDPLLHAILQGNLNLVKDILNKSGLNFSPAWQKGYALLCTAIKCFQADIASWLLTTNCSINRPDDEDVSDTPLHLAVYTNNAVLVAKLLKRGADVNAKTPSGQTPLHLCVQTGNLEICRLLLTDDLVADVPDYQSNTPFHIAVERELLGIVELLLSRGVDINAPTSEGFMPLHAAICKNNEQLVGILVESGADINVRNCNGETALHLCVTGGNLEICRLLLSDDLLDDVPDSTLTTPLHMAVESARLDIAELLLGRGVNVNTPTGKGFMPLHIAICENNEQMARLLVENGADVNAPVSIPEDSSPKSDPSFQYNYYIGYSPIHLAVEHGDESILELLEDNGADVSAVVEPSGMTAMHLAVMHENNSAVLFLCEYSDLLKSKTNEGKAVLHLAVENAWYDLIEVLLWTGANVNDQTSDGESPLFIAVEMGDEDIVELLLGYSADVDIKNLQDQSPLHVAAEFSLDIVRILLNEGAYVNEPDTYGETALFIAVEAGDEEIVQALLECRADPNVKNLKNQSPLHVAAKFSVRIVRMLLQAGAFVDELNNEDKTPLRIAVDRLNMDIIHELLEYKPDVNNTGNVSAFINAIKNSANYNYMDIVKLLLDNGFQLSAVDIDTVTELFHNFVLQGYVRMAEYLLDNGVDISTDSANHCNSMLLHTAIQREDMLMAEVLIRHNCILNAVDECGQTAVNYAIERRDLTLLDLLLTNGAKIDDTAHYMLTAAKDNDMLLIQTLLKYGADVSVSDEFGTTALHFATWNKHRRFVQFLLDKKACVNTTEANRAVAIDVEDEGNNSYATNLRRRVVTSPLHIAVLKKQNDICTMLLESHANINAKDGEGRTALHIAAAIKSADQKNIIKTLLSYGADINELDNKNKLPIYYVNNQTCVCSIAFQNQYEVYSECECDSFEDYEANCNAATAVFIKHMTLLSFMDKHVHPDNMKALPNDDESTAEQLQASCLGEISRMKEEKLWDHVAFYDILTKKSNALAAYARNEELVTAFAASNYQARFPLYGDRLRDQFDLAKDREVGLKNSLVAFNGLLDFQLPEVIARMIFDFLYLNDLNNVVLANRDDPEDNDVVCVSLAKRLKVW